jgi:hypothetical protein
MDSTEPVRASAVKTTTDIHNDLYALGQSSLQVANSLRDKKIKGMQRRAYATPISQYLSQAGYTNPVVGCMGIVFGEKDAPTVATTPGFIESFLNDFDSGAYPDLIDDALIDRSI